MDHDNFKFNTLVKFYYLFRQKQKITPLNFKFNKYRIFKLFISEDYEPVKKISYQEIVNLYKTSQKNKDMYDFTILLISDYYDYCFNKSTNLESINFLSKNKKQSGVFYNDSMEILLLIERTNLKKIYTKISPKIYHILIKKNDLMTEIYLFLIHALVSIKKKSRGENIVFDIFNQEVLLREKNEI